MGRSSLAAYARFGLAVIAGLWSYDGWNNLNLITAEMKQPSRDLPMALVIAMPLVILVYVMANVAYLAVVPISAMVDFANNQTNPGFVTEFSTAALGAAGRYLVPALIVASTFGAANASIFSGARLVSASALKGDLPAILGKNYGSGNPRPVYATIFQSVLGALMLLPSNFDELVTYFSAAAWLFYFLAVACEKTTIESSS